MDEMGHFFILRTCVKLLFACTVQWMIPFCYLPMFFLYIYNYIIVRHNLCTMLHIHSCGTSLFDDAFKVRTLSKRDVPLTI